MSCEWKNNVARVFDQGHLKYCFSLLLQESFASLTCISNMGGREVGRDKASVTVLSLEAWTLEENVNLFINSCLKQKFFKNM